MCMRVHSRVSAHAAGGDQQHEGPARPWRRARQRLMGSRLLAGMGSSCQAVGTACACSVLRRMLPEPEVGCGHRGFALVERKITALHSEEVLTVSVSSAESQQQPTGRE